MTIEDEIAQANQDASECFIPEKTIHWRQIQQARIGTVLGQPIDRLAAVPRNRLYQGDE